MTRARILEIVSDALGAPVSKDTAALDVAGWDSLKTLQIVMALDEAGYEIPIEKIAEIQSVQDILSILDYNPCPQLKHNSQGSALNPPGG